MEEKEDSPKVKISIYRSSSGSTDFKLTNELILKRESQKPLNSNRASRLLGKTIPDLPGKIRNGKNIFQ